MKKIYSLLALSFTLSFAQTSEAQLFQNMGFEDWSAGATPLPNGWTVNTQPVVKDVDSHSGNYCLKLKTSTDGSTSGNITQLVNVTVRPTSFSGWWKKVVGLENLSFYVSVQNAAGTQIGHIGQITMPNLTQGTWFFFSYPITYELAGTAAKVNINFQSGNFGYYASHYCAIDDLKISPSLNGIDDIEAIVSNYTISPSISQGQFRLDYSVLQTTPVSISVYDITGKKVADVYKGVSTFGNYTVDLNLDYLNAGIYICKLDTELGSKSLKLVIQK